MVQSQDAERSDTEAFVLPHTRLCSYSFFLALAPKPHFALSGDIDVMWRNLPILGVWCRTSGLGELGDHGHAYYYSLVYLSRLDPAPNRMAPDFLSIGKLR